MKKLLASLFVLTILLSGVSVLFAGGAENYNNNQSAQYARTMNRNASTDADAVFYNPAGTAMMKDGLYLSLSNQSAFQTYTITNDNDLSGLVNYPVLAAEYEGTATAPLFPNFYAVFKTGDFAAFLGQTIVGGGGSKKYDGGLPSFQQLPLSKLLASGVTTAHIGGGNLQVTSVTSNFEGSSFWIGIDAGVAYKIIDMLSVSVSGRYIKDIGSTTGNLTVAATGDATVVGSYTLAQIAFGASGVTEVDISTAGTGFGIIGGIDIAPMEGLNIGIKYDYYFAMKEKTTVNDSKDGGGLFTDGSEAKVTIPMIIAVGVSYNILPELRVEVSGNYAFNSATDWGEDLDTAGTPIDNAWEVGGAVEYAIFPELKASLGYLYSKSGRTERQQEDKDYELSNHAVCAGATYTVIPDLDVTLGYMHAFYLQGTKAAGYTASGNETYNKTSIAFAIGVQYRLLGDDSGSSDSDAPAEETSM
ncbi:MAG: outer membrane beta-barrel protein [bacterium]|nr:outer membrane beta-barrel protein [bacterium]